MLCDQAVKNIFIPIHTSCFLGKFNTMLSAFVNDHIATGIFCKQKNVTKTFFYIGINENVKLTVSREQAMNLEYFGVQMVRLPI